MNDLKKQILLDLLVTPTTCGLEIVGFSLLILSWAMGNHAVTSFIGLTSILLGFLVAGTNFALHFDEIGIKALQKLQEQMSAIREQELDELDKKLIQDRDPRDQSYLRDLRALYTAFQNDLKAGHISTYVTQETIEQLDTLFSACIKSLEHSYNLWRNSRYLKGDEKKDLLKERDHIIDEVGRSVETVSNTISQVRALNFKSKSEDLSKMRQSLEDGIEIARRAEERMRNFDNDDDLREYLKD